MKQLLTILFFLCGYYTAYGQRSNSFAVQSLFQRESVSFINCALWTDNEPLQVGNLSRTGPFSNIRSFYLGSFNNIGEQHGFGLSIIRYERGELISETTLNGAYRFNIPLSNNLDFALGTHIGFHQLGLEATDYTDGGGDLKFDFDLSTGVQSERFRGGLSLLNITEPKLVLVNDFIRFGLSLGVYAEYISDLNQDFRITTSFQSLHDGNESNYVLSARASYMNKYDFGVVVNNRSVGLLFGVCKVEVSKFNLEILGGFQRPILVRTSAAFNQFQIQLNFLRK